MTISAFPSPTPQRGQNQDVFDPAMDAFLAHLVTFVTEANALGISLNLNSTTDTSISSVVIGTGAKTFTVSASKSFQPGMYLVIADSTAPTTNSMIVQVTSYSGTTLVVDSKSTRGSGTIASWVISQTAASPLDLTQSWTGVNTFTQPVTIAAPTSATHAVQAGQMLSNVCDLRATVSGNILTVTLNPCVLSFKNGNLIPGGAPNFIAITSALTCVTPASGATLGSVNGNATRYAAVVQYNGGTPVLGIINLSGGVSLDETGTIASTTLSGSSTSATTLYATTGVSASNYRVVGYFDATEATAGTWATAPSNVQGIGGQGSIGVSGFGIGQTWQAVTRTVSTTYYNTTGRPILLHILVNANSTNCQVYLNVNTLVVDNTTIANIGNYGNLKAVIPPGASYSWTSMGSSTYNVFELR